ncbi:MAG: glycoside hydrolase, partial [Puniceicoccaceae bacterium]
PGLVLNDLEYLEMPGLNVMLAHDYYPESHQGGVGIIQNGLRVATNGDLRLDRTPGQWSPVPKPGTREVDRATGEIRVRMAYPDPEKNRRGFNPIDYPDLDFAYTIRVRPEGAAVRIRVDLETPLPAEWGGRVGFILELFPGYLFGKTFLMDGAAGLFPRQANGPGRLDAEGHYQIEPLATGRKLVVAPESERQRMVIEDHTGGGLELIDGRGQHDNGWFIVRTPVAAGVTKGAVDWLVQPHAIPDWRSAPVVQVSQVGYHPRQPKYAIVELDAADPERHPVEVRRVDEDGVWHTAVEASPPEWGRFLRYRYLRLDFSEVAEPGVYRVRYGRVESAPFRIGADVFRRHVWQPTLETFLPVQMCHLRINDRYRVWHGACHRATARMAPVNFNHIDGYLQGPETLCRFQPDEEIPGIEKGGWHDAGDHDLRVESQTATIHGLALAYEEFGLDYDNTTVDQSRGVVELHRPDGEPDALQQVEHGVLSVVGGYKILGRLYRGLIGPELRDYVLLGDPVHEERPRWVFTEDNPRRELAAAAGIAAAARVLRGFRDGLAADCLGAAVELWERTRVERPGERVALDVELFLTTGEGRFADSLRDRREAIVAGFDRHGWIVGRALEALKDVDFAEAMEEAARRHRAEVDRLEAKTPYGVPYEPNIWGAGWGIQNFGMRQYFLHRTFPEIFPARFFLHALNFILGCHPGVNTASFVSGVGSESLEVAYGFNRADWSYIPGGSASGTALIRPDFPELLTWPFLWQQTEYVLGGGTTDYLILALAADRIFNPD